MHTLIASMMNLFFDDFILKFIEAFIKNRRQIVVLYETASSWVEFLIGLPEGLVIGPFLFVIYTY